jgi:hypothetical protein
MMQQLKEQLSSDLVEYCPHGIEGGGRPHSVNIQRESVSEQAW